MASIKQTGRGAGKTTAHKAAVKKAAAKRKVIGEIKRKMDVAMAERAANPSITVDVPPQAGSSIHVVRWVQVPTHDPEVTMMDKLRELFDGHRLSPVAVARVFRWANERFAYIGACSLKEACPNPVGMAEGKMHY